MSQELTRAGEISLWQAQAQQLLKRRDMLVSASIPGWIATAVTLPKLISEALNSSQVVEPWLKIAAPLAILAGWGIFEVAEHTEKARLEVLRKLNRNGFNASAMLVAGKFPWIRHFADGEQVLTKIARLFGKI